MISDNDLHIHVQETDFQLDGPNSNKPPIGRMIITYEVRRYIDVRNPSETSPQNRDAYKITCTHRIVIKNGTPYELTRQEDNKFMNYPALLSNNITVNLRSGEAELTLLNYSPKTMNTAVVTSQHQGTGKSIGTSNQRTSGSSTAQTNTYGGSVSLGFFGKSPTGGASGDYNHSTTHASSTSRSIGASSGTDSEAGSGTSISIKDWGAYGFADSYNLSPSWVWGQEYPWNIMQFRYCPSSSVGNTVKLPPFIKGLLMTDGTVNPPSHLSLFGVDFTMQSLWILKQPTEQTLKDQKISLTHLSQYVTASHYAAPDNKSVVAKIDPAPMQCTFDSEELDLSLLALDPILEADADNGAVVGFIGSKFMIPPKPTGGNFKIISGANNVQVTGTGFGPVSLSAMVATFSNPNESAHLKLQFKIVDVDNSYTLYLKHWKTSKNGCVLTIMINGDTVNSLVKHVDSLEAAGGDSNLMEIELRNKDFSSIDYHDYLTLGLNTVDIEITPDTGDTDDTGYAIRALAISN